jgi:hypothetical protein
VNLGFQHVYLETQAPVAELGDGVTSNLMSLIVLETIPNWEGFTEPNAE